jgi:hypothetical protein
MVYEYTIVLGDSPVHGNKNSTESLATWLGQWKNNLWLDLLHAVNDLWFDVDLPKKTCWQLC